MKYSFNKCTWKEHFVHHGGCGIYEDHRVKLFVSSPTEFPKIYTNRAKVQTLTKQNMRLVMSTRSKIVASKCKSCTHFGRVERHGRVNY